MIVFYFECSIDGSLQRFTALAEKGLDLLGKIYDEIRDR